MSVTVDNYTVMRNACTVADCVNFIVSYSEDLTPSERSAIGNPVELVPILMRRRIARLFTNYTIRKCQDYFSVRCDNNDVQLAFKLKQRMDYYNVANYANMIDIGLFDRINALVEPVCRIHALTEGGGSNRVVGFKLREGDRLFFYINHRPYTHGYSSNYGEAQAFERRSLNAVMRKVESLIENLRTISATPLVEKFITFLSIHGNNLYYHPRGNPITEEFIDYALSNRQVTRYNELLSGYNRHREAATQAANNTPATNNTPRRRVSRTTVNLVVDGQAEAQVNTAPGFTLTPNISTASAAAQRTFADALARVRGRGQP